MGKSVLYNDSVLNKLHNFSKTGAVVVGLLIGQTTDQKDIVVHVTFTPKKEESNECSSSSTEENKEPGEHIKKAKIKESQKGGSKKKESSEDILDEAWICQHGKQVYRMLPGGLDVLGIFVIAPTEMLSSTQAKQRQVLFAMYRNRNDYLASSNEKILLQMCSVSKKFTCRTFDVSDFKSSSKPADWKQQPDNIQWHQIDSRVTMDLMFPVSRPNSKQSLLKQLLSGFLPFFTNIEEATALVNGRLKRMEELLDPSMERKRGGRSEKSKPTQHFYNIELMIPLVSNSKTLLEVMECCASMSIRGTIHCRAYVHNRATVQEAVQALKNDVIRSLRARCEIQCEDLLLIEEEQNDPSVIHELPKRVFAPLSSADITFCDYLFHGDLASDSLDAFDELLNLKVSENEIEMSLEQSPARRELLSTEETEDRLSEVGEQITNTGKGMLVPCVGIISAMIAIGVAYLWLTFAKSENSATMEA